MAGTRCANPEYQTDVDTMMVEYVLYKGIEAQIQLLTTLSEQIVLTHTHDIGLITEQAVSGLRLTEIYDSLMTLHKNDHGDILSENTQRNGRILRFLVHMNSWVMSRIQDLEDLVPQMSADVLDKQRRDMIVNQSCRRIWLKASDRSQVMENNNADDSWGLRNPQLSLADHLLPLFILISGELFEISKTPHLSLEWMKLATDLMAQAAIEILDAPDLLASGSAVAQDALQECFAWGSLDDSRPVCSVEAIRSDLNRRGFQNIETNALEQAAEMEDRCQNMFREHSKTENGLSGRRSFQGSQIPSWDSVKRIANEDVLMTFTSIQEARDDSAQRPIELLRKKYRLTTLLTDVNDFIAVHWRLLHSRAWHGKPLLVQVEEGGIEGLTPDQFEELKNRAGISDMWDSILLRED